MLYNLDNEPYFADQGKFRILFHFPGYAIAEHDDHGYGALATIAESFMDPDTWVKLHPHVNDEIISWVPRGVMRHNDPIRGELVTDKDHLMIMNAGKGFWHEEKTLESDPPLRMLQIFVRPHTVNLHAQIQHGEFPAWNYNEWRQVFGQEGSGSRFYVRNEIEMYDLRIHSGETISFPNRQGYDIFFFVFEGKIVVDGQAFGSSKSALLTGDAVARLTADAASLVVAFLIKPDAILTKEGTIGR